MITVEEREAIRRAYYLDRKSKRQIAREQGHSRKTIDKAVTHRAHILEFLGESFRFRQRLQQSEQQKE